MTLPLALLLLSSVQALQLPPAHEAAVDAACGWLLAEESDGGWHADARVGAGTDALVLLAIERNGWRLGELDESVAVRRVLGSALRRPCEAAAFLRFAAGREGLGFEDAVRRAPAALEVVLADGDGLWEDPLHVSDLASSMQILRGLYAAAALGLEVPAERLESYAEAAAAALDEADLDAPDTRVACAVAGLRLAEALGHAAGRSTRVLLERATQGLLRAPARAGAMDLDLADARAVGRELGHPLAAVRADSLPADYPLLLASQRPDGSWGTPAASDALDTARALLLLAAVDSDARALAAAQPERIRALQLLGPLPLDDRRLRRTGFEPVEMPPDGWGSMEALLDRDGDGESWRLRCTLAARASGAARVWLWVATDEDWELYVDGALHAQLSGDSDPSRPVCVPLRIGAAPRELEFRINDRSGPAAFGLQRVD